MDGWGESSDDDGDTLDAISNNIQKLHSYIKDLSSLSKTIGKQDLNNNREKIKNVRNDANSTIQRTKALFEKAFSAGEDKKRLDKLAKQFREALEGYQDAAQSSARKERDLLAAMEQSYESLFSFFCLFCCQ